MSIFRRKKHDDPDLQAGEAVPEGTEASHEPEVALMVIGADELGALEASATREIAMSASGKAAAALDAFVPLATNAAQAASEYGMAVVKFPEGVGWADLCVRNSDGWNLLSSFDANGNFNAMAAIKQAGVTPAAAANLALQAGAVAVGMVYMNQISSQLESLQSGIRQIFREMERERQARLKAAYDELARLALRQDEYLASPEKRIAAQGIVEDSRRAALEAWNFQLGTLHDYGTELAVKKKLPEEALRGEIARLSSIERGAATAFSLFAISQRVGMSLDNDYAQRRIETDRQTAAKMAEEFDKALVPVEAELDKRIGKIGGLPFLVADAHEDGYERQNPVFDAIHAAGVGLDRVNPVRMMEKAKAESSARKVELRGKMYAGDAVGRAAEGYAGEMAELDFAFNEADALLIGNGQVKAISTRKAVDVEKGTGESEEPAATSGTGAKIAAFALAVTSSSPYQRRRYSQGCIRPAVTSAMSCRFSAAVS